MLQVAAVSERYYNISRRASSLPQRQGVMFHDSHQTFHEEPLLLFLEVQLKTNKQWQKMETGEQRNYTYLQWAVAEN